VLGPGLSDRWGQGFSTRQKRACSLARGLGSGAVYQSDRNEEADASMMDEMHSGLCLSVVEVIV